VELWGGVECTINRVGDRWHSQLALSGHDRRPEDLDLIAALGIRTLRYPVLWEMAAPEHPQQYDFGWADQRLSRLRLLGIRPLVGLVHHGSGPRYTDLLDGDFAQHLAAYAGAVAARYPWVELYTPVNEPLTTARFSGLYGHWYPHGRDDRTFARALINQCRAITLAMRAIRRINPRAQLVQTEDLGTTFSTVHLGYQRDFDNMRRWLSFDLLCGRLDRAHPLHDYLVGSGIDPVELDAFVEHPCPPQIIGINHYVTSDRFLDERVHLYPASTHGGNGREAYADVEAVRALAPAYRGFRVLHAAWQRYGLPMVITEVQLACTREEQLRWLLEAWSAAWEARAQGCDVRAVTAWALFGAHNWDSLLVRSSGHYEPGAFDTRAPSPRPTALARLLREIASGSGEHHPCSIGPGWWQRPEAAFYGTETARTRPARPARPRVVPRRAPVLICGAGGSLGQALIAACEQRDLPAVPTRRHELDIGNPSALERTLEELRPWAIINAAGFVRVDEAEQRSLQCFQDNTHAADVLARVAERRDLPLVTYSTDLVFDGEATAPYGERAPTSPLNVYGRSKEAAERKVLRHARTLCIRTAAFFGAWGRRDFLGDALDALRRGERCEALQDVIVSPTYLPDLAHASLDLLIDEFTGLLHLVNGGALSWLEFARRGAMLAGLPAARVHGLSLEQTTALAPRPRFSALTSERLCIMPSLESALERYMQAARGQAQTRPERRALGA
jgi:dTDP-4-dehydrorhamnose reductase